MASDLARITVTIPEDLLAQLDELTARRGLAPNRSEAIRDLIREQVLEESLRVADGLATGSQPAIRWTKRALSNWLKTAGPIFDQSAAYEMLCFMGPDVPEGAAALADKRQPDFPSAR